MLIAVEGTGKSQQEQESVGDAVNLSHRSLLRYTWPKPTGVLEHFSGLFLLTAFLSGQRMPMYRNFPHAKILVNYTSEFPELFETTECVNSGWEFWMFNVIIYIYIVTTLLWRVKPSQNGQFSYKESSST